jgi:2,5-diamino-6-(ribosylamino)-4(3H)-pyrimidinone 5'-phosphate reductase
VTIINRDALRPFVYINMAMTADGKITSASREYPRLTSDLDRQTMDRLRAEADAIVVGAGTLRADNPALHVRDAGMRAHRESLGKPAGLVRVAVTASGALDGAERFFADEPGGSRVVATTEGADPRRLAALEERAEVWRLGSDRVDLPAMLQRLAGRGVRRVLVEGGGELNWCFVQQDLVDELYVTVAPVLLGGREAPTLLEGQGLPMELQKRLRLLDLRREGDEIYCRYAVIRP